jgi:hypothetical protein
VTYRDALAPDQAAIFDQAAVTFMADYAAAWADLFEYARVHGLAAAAERCMFPGRDVQEIQRRLQEIQDAARHRAAVA